MYLDTLKEQLKEAGLKTIHVPRLIGYKWEGYLFKVFSGNIGLKCEDLRKLCKLLKSYDALEDFYKEVKADVQIVKLPNQLELFKREAA